MILHCLFVTILDICNRCDLGLILDRADRVGVIHGNAVALVHIRNANDGPE